MFLLLGWSKLNYCQVRSVQDRINLNVVLFELENKQQYGLGLLENPADSPIIIEQFN